MLFRLWRDPLPTKECLQAAGPAFPMLSPVILRLLVAMFPAFSMAAFSFCVA